MPITTPSPEASAVCRAVGDIARSAFSANPRLLEELHALPVVVGETALKNTQTDQAASSDPNHAEEYKNAGDDHADLIDENGALAVTLEDGGDALDCGVCYLPLRPPIFQCENGHVLCFWCRRKLESTGNGTCHVCRVELEEDYDRIRCHAMERVVESVRVACPNAAHGCTARLSYYDRSSHRKVCPHARYSCSGRDCSFVGSLGALLDHVASVHTNHPAMQQLLTEEVSRLIDKLKVCMAVADIGVAGVHPLDIEFIMLQAGVSVDKAAKALKESDGNVDTAIRELTN